MDSYPRKMGVYVRSYFDENGQPVYQQEGCNSYIYRENLRGNAWMVNYEHKAYFNKYVHVNNNSIIYSDWLYPWLYPRRIVQRKQKLQVST